MSVEQGQQTWEAPPLCWAEAGEGEPFRFPETNCKEASLGRTQDQDKKWGSEKEVGSGGRSVILVLLHAKKNLAPWSAPPQ